MADVCPRCGAKLLSTHDAFCSECRMELDENAPVGTNVDKFRLQKRGCFPLIFFWLSFCLFFLEAYFELPSLFILIFYPSMAPPLAYDEGYFGMTIEFMLWPCILLGLISCAVAIKKGYAKKRAVAIALVHCLGAAVSFVLLLLYYGHRRG